MNNLTGNRRATMSSAMVAPYGSANGSEPSSDPYRELANQAFLNAFQCGLIAEDQPWMFMYSDSHHDYFKHKDTKEYIKCLKEVK